MTREEYIIYMKNLRTDLKLMKIFSDETMVSLDVAIKALEQQPCEDAVSRKAVLNTLDNMDKALDEDRTVESYKALLKECYEALPFVTSTQRWISVSERLPEEMGTYMTTIDYGKYGLATGQRYYYGEGLKWTDECVIAWMPLPEPYKQESEGK